MFVAETVEKIKTYKMSTLKFSFFYFILFRQVALSSAVSEKDANLSLLEVFSHRLIRITDRTLDVIFSRFLCVMFI